MVGELSGSLIDSLRHMPPEFTFGHVQSLLKPSALVGDFADSSGPGRLLLLRNCDRESHVCETKAVDRLFRGGVREWLFQYVRFNSRCCQLLMISSVTEFQLKRSNSFLLHSSAKSIGDVFSSTARMARSKTKVLTAAV